MVGKEKKTSRPEARDHLKASAHANVRNGVDTTTEIDTAKRCEDDAKNMRSGGAGKKLRLAPEKVSATKSYFRHGAPIFCFQRVLLIASKRVPPKNQLFMQERVKHTRTPRCTQTLGFLRSMPR